MTVCDARPVFATTTRFPEADEVVVDWPHRYLAGRARRRPDRPAHRDLACSPTTRSSTSRCSRSRCACPRSAYVGAMGSRRTHDDRLARLREAGLTEDELARLSSPIGLDLGARTPEETAISIAAEIIAGRWGGSGDRLGQPTAASTTMNVCLAPSAGSGRRADLSPLAAAPSVSHGGAVRRNAWMPEETTDLLGRRRLPYAHGRRSSSTATASSAWCAPRSTPAGPARAPRSGPTSRTRRTNSADRIAQVAAKLVSGPLWSGWGVRTLAADERAFDPLEYHNGTVWPHDNSLIALGLAQSGRRAEAELVVRALLDCAPFFEYRLPELFAGGERRPDEAPGVVPTSARPQAWAAGTPLLLLRAQLGLEPDPDARALRVTTDTLPPWLEGFVLDRIPAFGVTGACAWRTAPPPSSRSRQPSFPAKAWAAAATISS